MYVRPLTKTDPFTGKERTAAERLELAREALHKAAELLEQFANTTSHAHPSLTERDLGIICKACDMAERAAENAAFIGWSSYDKQDVEAVGWRDDPGGWAITEEPWPGLKFAGKED